MSTTTNTGGRPQGARSLRDDAILDLLDMVQTLHSVAEMRAHENRRLNQVFRLAGNARSKLKQAQALDDELAAWDGDERVAA